MAYCKYCGEKLDKHGKCVCRGFKENEDKVEKENENEEAIKGTVEMTPEVKKKTSVFKYIGIAAIVVVVFVVVISVISALNAYKSPVETLAKGISKADTELIMESIHTEDSAAAIRVQAKDNGLSWKDYLRQNDKAIKSALEGMGIKKVKAEVVAKEKLSGSNFDDVERYYEEKFEADVKKAYRVEVEFTLKVNGEKKTESGWLCVVKLKNEGWKYCKQYSPDSFDFIDVTSNIE